MVTGGSTIIFTGKKAKKLISLENIFSQTLLHNLQRKKLCTIQTFFVFLRTFVGMEEKNIKLSSACKTLILVGQISMWLG